MTSSLRPRSCSPDEDYDVKARWLDDRDGGDRWRAWAACRNEDPAMFFPIDVKVVTPAVRDADGNVVTEAVTIEEEPPYPPPEVKAICNRCPVAGRCLDKYMEEDYGIFGGTTGYQRQLMTKKVVRKKCVGCGSTDLVLNGNMRKEACLGCGLSWDVL